ncbi:hypothetical protein [Gryllotalpicola koreensis]|uniref:Uncharacterized protein n=1 Tax=Gryllotalpicola koreensis TaxID=993086 RepID=A0ABP7ZQG6_9MICO
MSEVNSSSDRVQRIERSLSIGAKCLYIYGVCCSVVVAVLIVTAALGGSTSTFMWVRALILAVLTPVLIVLLRSARRGSRAATDRVKLIMTVMPIAIVVVDFIPGICPSWYAAVQGIGALALLPAGVMLWRATARGSSARGTGRA